MSNQSRHRHRSRLRVLHHQNDQSPDDRGQSPPGTYQDQERGRRSVWLVGKRPPLNQYPALWRWLALLVYKRLHWTPDYGIDYGGVYLDEAEARHAASEYGGFYMELPWNSLLPPEPCQYGKHDFPLSEASASYRNRQPEFLAIRRETVRQVIALERLTNIDDRYEDHVIA